MKIRQLRKEKGLLQSDVAKMLNIPTSTYSGYEQGAATPSIFTIIKLADFYNVSLDYLMDRPYSALGYVPEEKLDTLKRLVDLPNSDFEKVDAYIQAIQDKNKHN